LGLPISKRFLLQPSKASTADLRAGAKYGESGVPVALSTSIAS